MAAPSLDRSRPFGTVSGDSEGRIYAQGEHFFHADGTLWSPPASAEAAPEAPAKVATKKKGAPAADPATAAVDDQLDAQMGAA